MTTPDPTENGTDRDASSPRSTYCPSDSPRPTSAQHESGTSPLMKKLARVQLPALFKLWINTTPVVA